MRKTIYIITTLFLVLSYSCKEEKSLEQQEKEKFLKQVIGDDYEDGKGSARI